MGFLRMYLSGMRVLFLGYADSPLIGELEKRGCEVTQSEERLTAPPDADLAISYGYRHILKREALSGCPIINLHIAYLPWNRGAHPNFWAFHDGTPHGVTIHMIDEGIDTGPILFQRELHFSPEEDTFAKTYWRLRAEMESLFIENADRILSGDYTLTPQKGGGSYHATKDLPDDFPGWRTKIKV